MSGAASTVSSMVKSGAISTSPPMLATTLMAIANPTECRSSLYLAPKMAASSPASNGLRGAGATSGPSAAASGDRKCDVSGESVYVRVNLGGHDGLKKQILSAK